MVAGIIALLFKKLRDRLVSFIICKEVLTADNLKNIYFNPTIKTWALRVSAKESPWAGRGFI